MPAHYLVALVRGAIRSQRASYKRLRETAFAKRIKIHDLLMEGVDLAIERRGILREQEGVLEQ